MFNTGTELREHLLSRKKLEPRDLDQLIEKRVVEAQHLDYKRGDKLENSKMNKEFKRQLKKWVSGFANAEGGVLIIGVAGGEKDDNEQQEPWRITGCRNANIGQSLKEWADNVLGELKPHLRPFPETQVVDHQNGPVLVIAVDRAPNLVPCVHNGRLFHYLRMGHQTVEIPAYLHADLVLGRRQTPLLAIDGKIEVSGETKPHSLSLSWEFHFENEGFLRATDISMGVVGYVAPTFEKVNRSVRRHIQVNYVNEENIRQTPITRIGDLDPLTAILCPAHVRIPLKCAVKPGHNSYLAKYKWDGALYVIMSNGWPLWHQLSIQGRFKLREDHDGWKAEVEVEGEAITALASHERPVISWQWDEE